MHIAAAQLVFRGMHVSDFATLMLEMSLEKAGSLSERERKKKKKKRKPERNQKRGREGRKRKDFVSGKGSLEASEPLRTVLTIAPRCERPFCLDSGAPRLFFFFLFFSKASPYGNSGLG